MTKTQLRVLWLKELRKQTFHTLKELNTAILEELKKHNNKKLTGRPYTRLELFNEIEKGELMPLPVEKFEIKQVVHATVMMNSHVFLSADKHYYSVPYQYIRKKVKIMYTKKRVEIFYKYNRIALHERNKAPYNYTTEKDHLATTHKFMTEWRPQRFIDWAAHIDDSVKHFIITLLQKKNHPEQAYKSCLGVLSYAKKVDKEEFIKAIKWAIKCEQYNYRYIQRLLEKGMDNITEEEELNISLPRHDNIRGKTYYK